MYPSFNARALGLVDLDAAQTIDLAAAAGFAGVDLLVRDLVERGDDPKLLRARMDDRGLRGGAWPLPVAWRGGEAQFQADLARLPRLAEAAGVLGLGRTGTWVTPEVPEPLAGAADPLAATRAWHAERLGAIARVLTAHGTRLGLEVIGPSTFRKGRTPPYLHRLADPRLDELIEAIRDGLAQPEIGGRPAVGILVDAFHLHAAGEGPDEALARGVGSIVWVHVADLPAGAAADRAAMVDADRGLPGEHGAIDVAGLLRRLAAQGYDGPVTVEPLGRPSGISSSTPGAVAALVAAALRAVWPLDP